MTTLKVRLKALWSPLVVIVVIAASVAVWHNLPTPTDLYGPFEVHGRPGESVEGRAVKTTVTSVHIAKQVNSAEAAGTWVVIDAALEAVGATELLRADLVVGPNTYDPSDRFFFDTLGNEISPGIVQRGSWVFDVASSLVAPDAHEPLLLRVWANTDILDSRLVIEIPESDPVIARSDEMQLMEREVRAQ
ncbi:hypothetical protein [Mycolicibacterium iranicum]|uniref:DUF4352 domain-containing protein n=1 Tax=Mycolicibacterium iranicum TaxID=912594 RepID=A0A178LQH8_MYCIR|nr:hypothetical protein [Mycolicibacterium iranicum]OAN33364.1 hypothetical protein A4X20_27980 [Mycolicibacterium iranicum]